MVTLKQYLENSWYRWASQDRQTWYAAQFQYGENVNIRDMKNGVCLSWGSTDVGWTFNYPFSYFTYEWDLYSVDRAWVVRDESGNTMCNLGITSLQIPVWVQFGQDIYIATSVWVYKIDSSWTYSNVTPSDPERPTLPYPVCILNYANTFFLVWASNQVWRYWIDWLPPKMIREFESWFLVQGLTQEWNYLKIYTSNGLDTKIHYAKGTFDVEYTWLIQTVWFNWLSVHEWWITSDQWQDYAMFEFAPWELKLAKISWYHKTDINWTQTWDWQKVFTSTTPSYITASDWVVFAATDEWIWTFTEYNWWLWWGCVEFKETNHIDTMFRYWEKLYICISNWSWKYKMRYYDLHFHPDKYQSSWFIIGRVFDWGCAGLFKKNDQATITYNMPVGTSMELSYRYDRETFWYDKSNFLTIKQLADTNTCYDIVVPTTPSKTEESNLLKEDWDLILLENWNWIKLEDTLVCPFNKTWNLLEYRFDLSTTDVSKTPILFEHSLTYYDYMRKYR
jgi:hypothetical protein